jgi:hypothetical protein
MKNSKLVLFFSIFLLYLLVFTNCIITNYDYDVHMDFFKNDTSRSIYVQYYWFDHNDIESGYFYSYGEVVPPHSISESVAPYANPNDKYRTPYLDKFLFIDADTRIFIKKITASEYYTRVTYGETVIEVNANGSKATINRYYFVINEEFLK